ncbi:gamma-type small acid-soluble spore protein [Novibacillus thermophilus]|jgi:small acid-soluble spore protein E (minor gamma-type SASP)|uniref:Small, acid-soluble spore protein gamma-type n=1 Tax=Novibacillus thermophilus TaxID=1471761 RepID=A0A1U9K8A3_9BACL|nr:gamma-type small acid-soluble spore protein [Novibacillus thermophilus]AQS56289.1 gamma-type small acid-soluble spore protein [Novibacillus thermophilus]
MAYQPKGAAKTNAQQVRQKNQQAAQGGNENEFAAETDAQEIRQQNQKSQQKKQQNQQ